MKPMRAIAEAAARAPAAEQLPTHKDPAALMLDYVDRINKIKMSIPNNRLSSISSVHLAILLANSPHFRTLISGNFLESFDIALSQLSSKLYELQNAPNQSKLKPALVKLNQKGLGFI